MTTQGAFYHILNHVWSTTGQLEIMQRHFNIVDRLMIQLAHRQPHSVFDLLDVINHCIEYDYPRIIQWLVQPWARSDQLNTPTYYMLGKHSELVYRCIYMNRVACLTQLIAIMSQSCLEWLIDGSDMRIAIPNDTIIRTALLNNLDKSNTNKWGYNTQRDDALVSFCILEIAMFQNSFYLADAALTRGMLADMKDKNGNTPLHMAMWGDTDGKFIKFLINAGVDPDKRNDADELPIDILIKTHPVRYKKGAKVLRDSVACAICKRSKLNAQIYQNKNDYF